MKNLLVIFIVLSSLGCSDNDELKISGVNNSNRASQVSPNANHRKPKFEKTTEQLELTQITCKDGFEYQINVGTKDNVINKNLNIKKDGQIKAEIIFPNGEEVKNLDLGLLEKLDNGFSFSADWGGGNNLHSSKYYFLCKDRTFYFYKWEYLYYQPQPDNSSEIVEPVKTKTIEPMIPINNFSIEKYLSF